MADGTARLKLQCCVIAGQYIMHVRRVHVQHLQLEFTFLFCPNYRISLTADIWAFTYHLCCVAKHIVG